MRYSKSCCLYDFELVGLFGNEIVEQAACTRFFVYLEKKDYVRL